MTLMCSFRFVRRPESGSLRAFIHRAKTSATTLAICTSNRAHDYLGVNARGKPAARDSAEGGSAEGAHVAIAWGWAAAPHFRAGRVRLREVWRQAYGFWRAVKQAFGVRAMVEPLGSDGRREAHGLSRDKGGSMNSARPSVLELRPGRPPAPLHGTVRPGLEMPASPCRSGRGR